MNSHNECFYGEMTKYCKKQLHKMQNLGRKVWNKVFEIL